jgi:hypothetical protein
MFTNMNVIKPPHSVVKNSKKGHLKIFLAGTIEMGNSEDWQTKVTEALSDRPYTILNPRREEWDSSWEQKIENPQFYQQVNWELDALNKADIIILYLLPDSKSPISLLELGLYASSGKLLVCCPEGFWRKGNVEIVCERFNILLYENIENLLHDNFFITTFVENK